MNILEGLKFVLLFNTNTFVFLFIYYFLCYIQPMASAIPPLFYSIYLKKLFTVGHGFVLSYNFHSNEKIIVSAL